VAGETPYQKNADTAATRGSGFKAEIVIKSIGFPAIAALFGPCFPELMLGPAWTQIICPVDLGMVLG
jgi:hypothetical protein